MADRLLKADILAFFKGPGAKERKAKFTAVLDANFGPGNWGDYEVAVVRALNAALADHPDWKGCMRSQITAGTANAVAAKLHQRDRV